MTSPYATHLPVLRAIGKVLPIRWVLEFGGGEYSTGEFLNRKTFPHLTTLITIERDLEWAIRLEKRFKDTRLLLVPPSTPYLSVIDLVFVDDGQAIEERTHTLQIVDRAYSGDANAVPVVVHDYEQPAYRAALHFEHEWIFDALLPNTGIVWNGDAISKEQIEEIERLSHEGI